MRRIVILAAMLMALGAAGAEAITVREIIELSKTGLSDEVLLALIDIERRVFPIDPETLKALKEAGVSERVILAMVKSGRIPPPQPEPAPAARVEAAPSPTPAPQPQVIVIEHRDEPRVREVPVEVAVPVYVPVYVDSSRRDYRHAVVTPPFSTIGLTHGSLGLSPAPKRPTSDPPYWNQWTNTHAPRGRK